MPLNPLAANMPHQSVKRQTTDEWAVLAGLRFFLASVVLCVHCRFLIGDFNEAPALIRFGAFFGGPASVFGFFLVSGYSIAASIQNGADGFYFRRMARIYPVYWATFALALLAFTIVGSPFKMETGRVFSWDPRWWVLLLNAIGLPCLFAPSLATFGPCWSLTCEIIYYAWAPLFKSSSTKVLLLLAALSFAYFTHHTDPDWSQVLYGRSVLALLGFWIAGFLFFRHRQNVVAGLVFVGGIVTLYAPKLNRGEPYACTNMFVTVLLITCAPKIHLPDKVVIVLTYLGELSYPIYLVHIPVYVVLLAHFRDTFALHPWLVPIGPACAILAAVFIYHVIDRPGRKFLLEKFGFRRPLAAMHTATKPA
jgi:peptidoglycan/LPS O-acetylase OafA/YrhL